jgi:hypothetical protein
VQPNTVESGTRLADRYRLEELLKAEDGFTAWRAVDEKLSRYVGVHVLPADHPRAKAVVQAAQAAAMLSDTRFCQVLDASQQGDVTYVVEEGLRGTFLAQLLSEGPLSPAEAASTTREVAAALAAAHEAGLAHLRLHPENVFRTETGQIKVFGLTVEAALYGIESDDPAAADARDLGALLYACLTARWPGGPAHGLAGAPYENGVICSPGQVRAGVPAALDDIAMRALADKPPHGGVPLRTPADVAAELATVRRLKHEVPDAPTEIKGALTAPPGAAPSPVPAPVPRPGPSRLGRLAGGFAALLLLAGVILLAVNVARNALDNTGDQSSGQSSQTPAAGAAIKIAKVKDFDPPGKNSDGEEHPDEVNNVLDKNPATAWTTKSYNDGVLRPFKPGVGLVLDLGSPQSARSVVVALDGDGYNLELRAAAESVTSMPGELSGYRQVDKKTGVSGTVTLNAGGTKTQFLLVWLTKLPPSNEGGGGFRGRIAEITVHS